MEKLNFRQAKYIFESKEAAMEYFVLVENYERYLSGAQKKDFLSATSINEMLELLDVKQIDHIDSLLGVFAGNRGNSSGKEFSVSEWYKENLLDKSFKIGAKLDNKQYNAMLKDAIKKIQKIISDIKTKRKNKQEIINNYKKNLNKFSGNSVEYRKWIFLNMINSGIPGINKIYDTTKLLKSLDTEDLRFIEGKVNEGNTTEFYLNYTDIIKSFEPYFYESALDKNSKLSLKAEEYKVFKKVKDTLLKEISIIISQKSSIKPQAKDDSSLISQRIEALKNSKDFYKDVANILRNIGGNFHDEQLKIAIGDYSKPHVDGLEFNDYLRRAIFLKDLAAGKISTADFRRFRGQILQVREYFLKHLIQQEYTVYRGMDLDCLERMIKVSRPKILSTCPKSIEPNNIECNNFLLEINRTRPIIYDQGLVSTSPTESISAVRFQGKAPNGVFFKIYIPKGSKALVLNYEGIRNIPDEEEILLAEKTKMKINSIKVVTDHFEIDAEVVR